MLFRSTGLYINPRRRASAPTGLRACVSSWTRTSDNAIPIRLKSGSNYQNGRLATLQAKADGYDTPILLNQSGTVAEGTGATFFMVRRGTLLTPPLTADILESITRTTLLQDVIPDLRLDVQEREIARTELYVADEAFLCGSGYEITPVLSIDKFPMGSGEVGSMSAASDRYVMARSNSLTRRAHSPSRYRAPARSIPRSWSPKRLKYCLFSS